MTTTTNPIPFHHIDEATEKACRRLLTWVDGTWVRNEFHGYDCVVADGSVRLAGQSVWSEDGVSMMVFDRNLSLRYQVRFDAATPQSVIVAAITAALS